MATNDGLNRFDGYEFKVYGYQSNGFNSNLIVCIDEDSHGNLWIGTADRGVFLFNSVKNEFVSLNLGHSGIDKISLAIRFLSTLKTESGFIPLMRVYTL